MAPAISLLSQLRFPGVGAIRLDISARHAVHLIDPRKAVPPGPQLAGADIHARTKRLDGSYHALRR